MPLLSSTEAVMSGPREDLASQRCSQKPRTRLFSAEEVVHVGR